MIHSQSFNLKLIKKLWDTKINYIFFNKIFNVICIFNIMYV